MNRKPHPHKVFHWPRESGEHNFVQVKVDYQEPGFREYSMLAFPHNDDTHGDILARFLKEIGMRPYPMFNNGEKKIPSLRGKNYDVVGLGRGYFDKDALTLEILDMNPENDYGEAGYRLGSPREHLEEVTEHSKINLKYK